MASGMETISPSMQEQISELLKPHRVCLARTVGLNHSTQPEGRSESRVLVESSFSFLEISSINIFSLTQVVFEMDSQTLSFSVSQIEDLETMISHMTTALKKIFPDSSPRKLLKKIPSDIQDRIYTLSTLVEEQLDDQPASCGGFSDTYAALCDFNETPCRQEIQWDVDNIFYVHNCQEFNLLHFSHLESKDLALAVAALSFNQWFTRIYSKELKLSADIQQQLVFLLSRSPCLEELSLEASGLKLDFAIKAATALREHASSSLHSINLSANPIEDKGVIALSQELGNLAVGLRHLSLSRVSMSARGLGSLCQVLSTVQLFSDSLTHLDLSGNPGSLATEEATPLFRFLSSSNSLSFLDLSGTECPLDTLFVSLSAGCCSKLSHLNLAKNPFSLRKVQKVTRSIQEFFSQSCSLKYVGLSATRLPPQALKLLLQGLATNTCISGLELDIKSCELRSAGAQVIQEHIFEATAISSLDISDNGFESDMVTLILSLGRCQSLRHLALGRNFSMKSRALTDVLQRIAQLVQEEECPLESLSVCDSKLKAGTTILINSLGSSTSLTKVDISGNAIGNTGAKMLAKALLTNTKLRTVVWDRNNITARGFQDVADALERNFTLQEVTLPLADVIQSYRSSSDRTEEALHKMQRCLQRNNQRQSEGAEFPQGFRTQYSEKLVQDLCKQLQDSVQLLTCNNIPEVQDDIIFVEGVLQNVRNTLRMLPSLYELGRSPSDGNMVNCILTDAATALTNEINGDIQELAQSLKMHVEGVCPWVMQHSRVGDRLAECVSKRSKQTETFLRTTLEEHTRRIIINILSEVRQSLCASLVDSLVQQMLQDLALAQGKIDRQIRDNACSALRNNIPQIQVGDYNLSTDEYIPATWITSFYCRSLRPAPSIKSLLDVDTEQYIRDMRESDCGTKHPQHQEEPHRKSEEESEKGAGANLGAEEEGGGGGRCTSVNGRGLPQLLTATLLPVTVSGSQLRASSPAPSPSSFPSLSRSEGRRRREGEVDAAAAVSGPRRALVIPPPDLPRFNSCGRVPQEEAAGRGGLTSREAPFSGCGPSPGLLLGSVSPGSPMELLPTQGQALKHYTASRPRPRRTRTQPPSSRPQEPVSETENEANEGMGRVDEGVEEFFTKKIIPDYVLKGRWEESNPAEATPSDSSSTPSVPAPLSPSLSDSITSSTTVVISSSALPSDTSLTHTKSTNITSVTSSTTTSSITSTTTTPPSKNIKKKFGDFFAFKRARAGRASKAGGGEGGGGGGGEGAKVKRTSIADLIRPLREAKERERERERERDKEREKERGTRSVEDVNVSNDATMTEGTVATDDSGDRKDKMAMMTPPIKATAPSLTTTFLDLTTAAAATTLSNLEEEVVTSLPVGPGYPVRSVVTPPMMTTSTEWEKSRMLDKERMMGGGTPDGERRLKVARRSLREGKSQSLILLTGLEPNEQNKRHASEGTSSFEQKLQVMLHKMGVAKTPPADTKASQSKEEELRKANSEGAILDKPEPTSIFIKPRTMSTSSDTRRPQRAVDPFSSDPPLHPKPPLPERPAGPLPPKPVLSAKPPLPIPAASAGGGFSGSKTAAPAVQQVFPPPHHLPSSAHGTLSQAEARPRPSTHEGKAETDGSKTQIENQQEPLSQAPIQKDGPAAAAAPPAPSPRRGASAQHRSEKAQSATDESLPKPHPRLKPLPQRRAVSVHEDAFAMTQELKAVLQRSPIRHRDNRADLPTCTEDTPTGEEVEEVEEAADRGGEPGKGKKKGQEKEKLDKSKMEKGRTGEGEMADNKSSLGEEKTPVSAPVEKDPNSTSPGGGQKPPLPLLSVTPALEKVESTRVKSPVMAGVTLPASGATCLSPTLEKVQVTPSQGKSPSTNLVTVDVRNSTQEKKKTVLKQHITEPPDQRTDAPVSK